MRRWSAMLLAAALTPHLVALELPVRLAGWKSEIEKVGGAPLLVAEVRFSDDGSTMTLEEGAPRAALFARYLEQPQFASQFAEMFAVTVHHKEPGDEAFLVMVNGRRKGAWKGYEEAVLGHELGHAWIRANQYAAPVFVPGRLACLAIHTGDVVQHVLIRKELDRRGIEHIPFWLKTLDEAEASIRAMDSASSEDRCLWVRQAAQSIDVRLGLEGVDWPGRERYQAAVGRLFPQIRSTVNEITEYLKKTNVGERRAHRAAIEFVYFKLRDLALERSREYLLENGRGRSRKPSLIAKRCATLNEDPGAAWRGPARSRAGVSFPEGSTVAVRLLQ